MTTHPRRAARITACAVAVTALSAAALTGTLSAGPAQAQDDEPLPGIPSIQPVKPGQPVPSMPPVRPTDEPSPTYSTFTRPPQPTTSAPSTSRPVITTSRPAPTSTRPVPTSTRPVPPVEPTVAPETARERAVEFVLAQVGKPHAEGGTNDRGWGNNELIRAAFEAQGINLPAGDAHDWWHYGEWIDLSERLPGDVLLYKLRGETFVRSAMFAHDVGRLIEAVPGGTVKEFPLYATVTQGKVLRPTGVFTPSR